MKNLPTASLEGAGKARCAAPAGNLFGLVGVWITLSKGLTLASALLSKSQLARRSSARNRCNLHDDQRIGNRGVADKRGRTRWQLEHLEP